MSEPDTDLIVIDWRDELGRIRSETYDAKYVVELHNTNQAWFDGISLTKHYINKTGPFSPEFAHVWRNYYLAKGKLYKSDTTPLPPNVELIKKVEGFIAPGERASGEVVATYTFIVDRQTVKCCVVRQRLNLGDYTAYKKFLFMHETHGEPKGFKLPSGINLSDNDLLVIAILRQLEGGEITIPLADFTAADGTVSQHIDDINNTVTFRLGSST